MSSQKKDWVSILVTTAFLIVPLGSSFMSLHHVKEFIALGNPEWMAWFISVIYELASIAILVAIVRLDKLNPYFVWASFMIVVFLQVVGNAYFIYDYVKDMVLVDKNWITNFVEFSSHMFPLIDDQNRYVFILSCVLGVSVPALSVLLTKSATDYLASKREENSNPTPIEPESHTVQNEPEVIYKYQTEVKNNQEVEDKPTEPHTTTHGYQTSLDFGSQDQPINSSSTSADEYKIDDKKSEGTPVIMTPKINNTDGDPDDSPTV